MPFVKIFAALLFLVVLGLGVGAFADRTAPQVKSKISGVSESSSERGGRIADLEVAGSVVRVAWFEVSDPSKISLQPNFDRKEAAIDLVVENRCRALVSGGFYGKDGQPIGLFISNGSLVSKEINDDFFSGFLVITKDGEARLLAAFPADIPDESFELALQSGPWLIRDRQPRHTSIRGDKFARRIAVAQATNNALLFLAIFDPQNILSGPKLADLPDILIKFEEELGTRLNDALNLDGGAASAFYTDFLQIPERTSVGSFFCIRE